MDMYRPVEITSEERSANCGCGLEVPIASLTTWLEISGVDFEEWDDTEVSRPFRRGAELCMEGPNHKERKFCDWSRAHGLSDDTVFTLLHNNIKRIATLRNTPTDFLEEIHITKGQKLILKSLMLDDWSCAFCGTYHDSPKNNCSISRTASGVSSAPFSMRSGSLKTRGSERALGNKNEPGQVRHHNRLRSIRSTPSSPRCTSLPVAAGDEDYAYDSEFDDQDDDPIDVLMRRGRRNTTGQNFGYLNCHPKYWADILPVPTKLIKML